MEITPDYVEKFLAGLDYPAGKEAIVTFGERQGADGTVMNALRDLPDRQYGSPDEVRAALTQLSTESAAPDTFEEAHKQKTGPDVSPETETDAQSPSPGRALGGATSRAPGASGSRGT